MIPARTPSSCWSRSPVGYRLLAELFFWQKMSNVYSLQRLSWRVLSKPEKPLCKDLGRDDHFIPVSLTGILIVCLFSPSPSLFSGTMNLRAPHRTNGEVYLQALQLRQNSDQMLRNTVSVPLNWSQSQYVPVSRETAPLVKELAEHVWWPEFELPNPHCRRRKSATQSCSLVPVSPPHNSNTHAHINNNNERDEGT